MPLALSGYLDHAVGIQMLANESSLQRIQTSDKNWKMSIFVCSFYVGPVWGVGKGEVEAGGGVFICGECSSVHSVIVFCLLLSCENHKHKLHLALQSWVI